MFVLAEILKGDGGRRCKVVGFALVTATGGVLQVYLVKFVDCHHIITTASFPTLECCYLFNPESSST